MASQFSNFRHERPRATAAAPAAGFTIGRLAVIFVLDVVFSIAMLIILCAIVLYAVRAAKRRRVVGTRRATGRPWRVITTSSPRKTRSTRCDNCVLAS